jgi:hypothetical protein
MPRIVLSLAEWKAIAHELDRTHTASTPAELSERIQALLAQAPPDWPVQDLPLELDASSAEAVQAIYARLSSEDPGADQRAAAVAEAMQIIHDHQQRT